MDAINYFQYLLFSYYGNCYGLCLVASGQTLTIVIQIYIQILQLK